MGITVQGEQTAVCWLAARCETRSRCAGPGAQDPQRRSETQSQTRRQIEPRRCGNDGLAPLPVIIPMPTTSIWSLMHPSSGRGAFRACIEVLKYANRQQINETIVE